METDDQLLGRLRRLDPSAVAEVRGTIARAVAFRGWKIPADEREDIASEALRQVLSQVLSADFVIRESVENLAVTVASRRCVDWVRKERRRAAFEVALGNGPDQGGFVSADPGPEEALLMTERLALRDRILDRLPDCDRELLHLRIQEDLGYQEIAELQHRSYDAVRRHWCDCMKRVAKIRDQLLRDPRRRFGT